MRQKTAVAGLLDESPERTNVGFRRLGVEFVLHPVQQESGRPFYRAVGTKSVAHVLSGAGQAEFTTSAELLPEHLWVVGQFEQRPEKSR